eukprot:616280-Pelagomonas_calceolata.AAC.1
MRVWYVSGGTWLLDTGVMMISLFPTARLFEVRSYPGGSVYGNSLHTKACHQIQEDLHLCMLPIMWQNGKH